GGGGGAARRSARPRKNRGPEWGKGEGTAAVTPPGRGTPPATPSSTLAAGLAMRSNAAAPTTKLAASNAQRTVVAMGVRLYLPRTTVDKAWPIPVDPRSTEDVPAKTPSTEQEQADALVLLTGSALHHGIDPGAPGERPQVVVHVDAPVLADPGRARSVSAPRRHTRLRGNVPPLADVPWTRRPK